jgi:DNA polymerase-3 subunit alpha
MEAAKVIAGYTLGGADMLRRAMGKKDVEAMAKERAKFVEGAKRVNNIDEKTADSIFDILNKFAGYGFNKSHSAAYAVLSYQTGYLKANYPVQFMAAMLSSELGNSEKVAHFIAECESMGLKVLGPDVNESREMFTPVIRKTVGALLDNARAPSSGAPTKTDGVLPSAIRFGLAGIKGVGEQAAQKIIEERELHGPFADFEDFVRRVDARALNKRVLEHLVKTGAFDFSGASRKQLFEGIDAALGAVAAHARDKAAGQHSFLDMLADEKPAGNGKDKTPNSDRHTPNSGDTAVSAGDFTPAERLQFEKELLGFYVSGHPMNLYIGLAEAIDTHTVDELIRQTDRVEFRLCGIAGNIAKKLSKKDNRPWAAFTLATRTSSVPLNMFADAYAAYAANLLPEQPVLVQGNIIGGTDGARINVKECYPLDNFVTGSVRKVTWLLHPQHPELPAFFHLLREIVNKQTGDTRLEFGFLLEDRVAPVAEVSGALSWKLTAAVFQQLRAHPAVAGVQLETKRLELKQDRRWSKR